MNHQSTYRRRAARRRIDVLVKECGDRIYNHKAEKAFWTLVSVVRMRSDLLTPFPGCRHSTTAVLEQTLFGLMNLAMSHKVWLRESYDWRPLGTTRRAVFGSLVRYLIDDHEVPEFMLPVWFSEPTGNPSDSQRWYVHIARTGSVRGLQFASHLDREQARCFLEAPHHSDIAAAMRWADNRRVSRRKQKNEFSVLSRRRRKERQARRNGWFRNNWKSLGMESFYIAAEETSLGGARSWTIRELLTRRELNVEGERMDHCVGSYALYCQLGISSIWSLKEHSEKGSKRLLTIEVDPDERKIVTALGHRNHRPCQEARYIMNRWATRSGLQISSVV